MFFVVGGAFSITKLLDLDRSGLFLFGLIKSAIIIYDLLTRSVHYV